MSMAQRLTIIDVEIIYADFPVQIAIDSLPLSSQRVCPSRAEVSVFVLSSLNATPTRSPSFLLDVGEHRSYNPGGSTQLLSVISVKGVFSAPRGSHLDCFSGVPTHQSASSSRYSSSAADRADVLLKVDEA